MMGGLDQTKLGLCPLAKDLKLNMLLFFQTYLQVSK